MKDPLFDVSAQFLIGLGSMCLNMRIMARQEMFEREYIPIMRDTKNVLFNTLTFQQLIHIFSHILPHISLHVQRFRTPSIAKQVRSDDPIAFLLEVWDLMTPVVR